MWLLRTDIIRHAVEVDVVVSRGQSVAVAGRTDVEAEGGEDAGDAVVGVGDDADYDAGEGGVVLEVADGG